MYTDVALHLLRRASNRFTFGKMDDGGQGGCRFLELSVWWNGRHVGHLEHDEMPTRGTHIGGDAVLETMGRLGDPWTAENKARGWRPYYRKTWRRCLREIRECVPNYVQRRLDKVLRKEGYSLR